MWCRRILALAVGLGVVATAAADDGALRGASSRRAGTVRSRAQARVETGAALVALRSRTSLRTIAHTTKPQAWLCSLISRSDTALRDLRVRLSLDEFIDLSQPVGRLGPGQTVPVVFRFVPDVALGSYTLSLTVVRDGEVLARTTRAVEITPQTEPFENLQISAWGGNAPRESGFTLGGGDVEDCMRRGLHWSPLVDYPCHPRGTEGPDWGLDMTGRPVRASVTAPYIREQIDREAERLAVQYEEIPAMRGVTLNSGQQWTRHHDFSAARREWVRDTFGLDLTRWQDPPKEGGIDAHQTAFGCLRPSAAGIGLPPDRIISVQTPVYAYHRWFHGVDGPTESYLNQRISDVIHRRRPDILAIQEPILRRPAVRAFSRVNVAQEWFSCEDPLRAVMVQERLNAAVRGTAMRPSGMPQFLLARGRAAPYNAVVTADMFREAAWLCALQPIRMLTYRNFDVVPESDFENAYHQCMTKAQIDTFFGTATPTWEEAEAALSRDPALAGRLLPWTPELIGAFKRFHTEEIGPLGALITRWRNGRRQIAVLRSLASQVFGEKRRPGTTTWLEECVVRCGVPFDVLYDSDFEKGLDPLSSCRLLVVSGAVCVTRPVYERIAAFSRRGGVVVVDPETAVVLPGAVSVEPTGALPAFSRLVAERVKPSARSLTPDTWLNLLTADGASYIGVVNDLRVSGPMYGHFGKVRETGVPQTARIAFSRGLGSVAYDLLSHKQVEIEEAGTVSRVAVDLPAGGARVIMVLRQTIGQMDVRMGRGKVTWGSHSGLEFRLGADLLDPDGQPVRGLVPATVTVRHPDGSLSDYSRHAAFRNGVLLFQFPWPRNGPPGKWRVTVLERASGLSEVVEIGD